MYCVSYIILFNLDFVRYESDKIPRLVDVTQMRWENFTHIGCGWFQIKVGQDKWALQKLSGEFENFAIMQKVMT